MNNPQAAVAYYDTLIAKYPASDYVKIIAPKVSFYKQEKRKVELALQDSLHHLTQTDTLGTDSMLVTQEELVTTDSVQVAVKENEQQPNQQQETPSQTTKTQVVKEPIWNPRKR